MERPLIAVTMGDPSGIGPEIIVKALQHKNLMEQVRPCIIGNGKALKKALGYSGVDSFIQLISKPEEGRYMPGHIDLVEVKTPGDEDAPLGKITAAGGLAAVAYIRKATEFALSKEVAGIATAPINKESLKAAGIKEIGHTEILAELAGAEDPLTMFQVAGLRVFFLSRHVSLRKACEMVTRERVYKCLIRCGEALQRLGIQSPHIAVAGLNPHCGEHGMFGDEEGREIEPGIDMAVNQGLRVTGPIGADSVFHLGLQGRFDAVLSLYHDQGHIATKMVDFERTIAITNGLPFLRTSVDHGTAFDIAGKGLASEISMVEAIRLAALYGAKFQ